jgi:hypothetical protein
MASHRHRVQRREVFRGVRDEVGEAEISGGTFEVSAMMGVRASERTHHREAYFRRYAETARARTRIPVMLTGGFRTAGAMRDAVASGIVDVIGLARPIAVDPTFARRLLDGTADGIHLPPRRHVLGRLDGLAEVAWYTRQLRRLSGGREANHALKARTAVLAYLATTAGQAVARLRAVSKRR